MPEGVRTGDAFLRATIDRGHIHRIFVVVVAFPDPKGKATLFEVVGTTDFTGFLFGSGQRRQ